MKNSFYVAKLNESTDIYAGYSWSTGKIEKTNDLTLSSSYEIDVRGHSRFISDNKYKDPVNTTVYFLDENKKVITSSLITGCALNERIPDGIAYVAVQIKFKTDGQGWDTYQYTKLKKVTPHYSNLVKQFSKESNQLFFRETLDGKIVLWNFDYLYIRKMSVEDKLAFYTYKNDLLFSQAEFTKTDCKFDHYKGSVELNLSPTDKYTNILNSYEKKYDLLKLATPKTSVAITKRAVVQIYVQGDDVITNYAGGTHWEDEVTEAIDNQSDLQDKYYFAKGPQFSEISLVGFNYDINSVYKCVAGQRIWNGTSTRIDANGKKYKFPCSIVFTKVGSAGQEIFYSLSDVPLDVVKLSDGKSYGFRYEGNQEDGYTYYYMYDTYRIEIYTGNNGTGTKIYQSECVFGNDSDFIIKQGSGLYKMVKISQPTPYKEPDPASFFLGEQLLVYQLWGRLLCDVEKSTDGTATYELPYDDFATQRANLKRCIGLTFSDTGDSLIHFKQSVQTQSDPTPYGLDEYGAYFVAPTFTGNWSQRLFPYPLARSTWGNSSLWVSFEEDANMSSQYGLENLMKHYYKSIQQRDMIEIGGAIKVLLKEIDPTITFDSTPEYSAFLYDKYTYSNYGANDLSIYITQKSNILKGEYDQAAQKAEITFKQLMDMLRDCFKCYWYIDSNNRFRIEHIRYFMQGLTYGAAGLQLDLTDKNDKFNKKAVLYAQQEISYTKSNLNSRYEFAWADDATAAMGGGFTADINSNMVEADKVESINIESFSSDIDFMMFAPDRFSQDGFALVIAKNGVVPIVYDEIYDQRDLLAPMRLFVQNYHASFISLFSNYLYDMPAYNVNASIDRDISRYTVKGIKRSMEHSIEFQSELGVEDVYELIRTDIGNGHIETASVNIDTSLTKVTLSYEPI